jgi:hypothetical protein
VSADALGIAVAGVGAEGAADALSVGAGGVGAAAGGASPHARTSAEAMTTNGRRWAKARLRACMVDP